MTFAKIEPITGEQAAWVIERYAAWVLETPGIWAVTLADVVYTKKRVDLHLIVHADIDEAPPENKEEVHEDDPS